MTSLRFTARALVALGMILAAPACGDDAVRAPDVDAIGPDADAIGPDADTIAPDAPLLAFEKITWDDPLEGITGLRFVPGTADELILLHQSGEVLHARLEGDSLEVLGSFTIPEAYRETDCGLVSAAFDPDYADNGYLYVGHCVDKRHSGVYRYDFDPEDMDGISETRVEILERGDPAAGLSWHNIGAIGFDDAGHLWALFGDKSRGVNALDLSNDLGALIRVTPSREPGVGGFDVVEDNPFVGLSDHSPNILAHGLRSPWTGITDARGRYLIGDVGQGTYEEINLYTPGDAVSFGWPDMEGPACVRPDEDCPPSEPPLVHWDRGLDHPFVRADVDAIPVQLRVAYVALQYSGDQDRYQGALTDHILYGEMCVGFVRAMRVDAAGEITEDRHVAHLANPTSWAEGPDGHIYVTTYGECESPRGEPLPPSEIWRVVLASD